jgi:hypothetical protein
MLKKIMCLLQSSLHAQWKLGTDFIFVRPDDWRVERKVKWSQQQSAGEREGRAYRIGGGVGVPCIPWYHAEKHGVLLDRVARCFCEMRA